MREFYVIQEVDGMGFWSDYDSRFRGYLWTDKFETKAELLQYAQKRNIGIFIITKVYDTKA